MLASDIERNASVHVGALLSEHLCDDRIDAREHVSALHKLDALEQSHLTANFKPQISFPCEIVF